MNVDDVRAHFGNWTQAMRGLNLGVNSYRNWINSRYIPMPTQLKIEKATKGKLVADINKKQG